MTAKSVNFVINKNGQHVFREEYRTQDDPFSRIAF